MDSQLLTPIAEGVKWVMIISTFFMVLGWQIRKTAKWLMEDEPERPKQEKPDGVIKRFTTFLKRLRG